MRVWYEDGHSAARFTRWLRAEGGSFFLTEDGLEDGPYAFADLVPAGRADGLPVYGHAARPGWRIGLEEDAPEAIAAQLPQPKPAPGPAPVSAATSMRPLAPDALLGENVRVWHYDGLSAVKQIRTLYPRGDQFVLAEGMFETEPHAFKDLVSMGATGGAAQYGLRKRPGWKIGLDGEPPAGIAAMLPGAKRYGGVIDRIGLVPAVIVFAVLSVLVVVAVLMSPPLIASAIPRSTEREMGDLMIGDVGTRACHTKDGDAALAALEQRIGAPNGVDIRVVSIPIPNAVTFPGGHILVFSGLLDQAASADEVAGVLGHEIGHYEHRDPLEGLIRDLGLSAVFQGMNGNVAGLSHAVLGASYSRNAEARADSYAIETLQKHQVSTKGAADFFRRMEKEEKELGAHGVIQGYFASHPGSASRAAEFDKGDVKGARPVLDAEQWRALRHICSGVKPGSFFF
ncbi:M48 family metallopeptidase [Sphingomonas sp.]|uniref:M48 family metallopeptidase n=1 Tax=Sphingomonas sp. TaxID=28214 RepID=UPI0025E50921|nr:M48 family metallopeptidase [Sphingomonas sp.]